PELCDGTEVIKAVVSGATVIIKPMPKRMPPGSKSVIYERGGMNVDGLPGMKCQGVLLAGIRANQRAASAMIAGPSAMNQRGPYRLAKLPKREEPKMRKKVPGIPASPAPAAA